MDWVEACVVIRRERERVECARVTMFFITFISNKRLHYEGKKWTRKKKLTNISGPSPSTTVNLAYNRTEIKRKILTMGVYFFWLMYCIWLPALPTRIHTKPGQIRTTFQLHPLHKLGCRKGPREGIFFWKFECFFPEGTSYRFQVINSQMRKNGRPLKGSRF